MREAGRDGISGWQDVVRGGRNNARGAMSLA
jgi:hypothetical protein